jgi:hypothetical protein
MSKDLDGVVVLKLPRRSLLTLKTPVKLHTQHQSSLAGSSSSNCCSHVSKLPIRVGKPEVSSSIT